MFLHWSSHLMTSLAGAAFKVGVPPEAGGCGTTVASSGSDEKSAVTLILFFLATYFFSPKVLIIFFLPGPLLCMGGWPWLWWVEGTC